MTQTRQLAAILFADIENYSLIMQDDEAKAIALSEKLRSVLVTEASVHGGHLHKWTGDGALCSFTSSVEAIRAAISVQKEMIREPRVAVRIGIHAGDVMLKENDLFGDGVNIASRIESFALAGGVFISGKVYDDIRNQRDIQTVSLGKFALKNIKELTEIFAVTNEGMVVPTRKLLDGKGIRITSTRRWLLPAFVVLLFAVAGWISYQILYSNAPSSNSIAVLPFVDMSANQDQEYFGDGLSEELLNHLAKIPGLMVIARTSSFSFKGKNEDLRTIGKKLGVTNILEGSVRKSNEKIRITAQLNNAIDGTHIWSETYDRTLDDIFKVQDEIAIAVVRHLKATLLKDTAGTLFHGNPEAYDLMLLARHLSEEGTDDSVQKAVKIYEQALTLDSDNAVIYGALSQAYLRLAQSEYLGRSAGMIKARQLAEKAIKADPNLPDGYVASGRIKQVYDWDWKGAAADYQKAFDLSPQDPSIVHRQASLARTLGDFDKAIALYETAIALDPVNGSTLLSYAITLNNANRLEESKEQFRKVLQINPQYGECHTMITLIYLLQKKNDSAFLELQMETDPGWRASALPMVYYSLGRYVESEAALKQFIKNYSEDWSYQIAENYAWRADSDQAFLWLERAYSNRDAGLAEFKGSPYFKKIENDPRYSAFMNKMGLH